MSNSSIHRFGAFELDVDARSLHRDGRLVALSPQALAVLLHLLEQRERQVTRDELFRAGWPGVAVSDGSLTQAVWEIRRTLAQDQLCRVSIHTVRGVGYRLSGEVEVLLARVAPRVEHERVSSIPPMTSTDQPFLGRELELSRLRGALSASAQGRGRTCLVIGPAAIGKTRICRELLLEARDKELQQGWTLLAGHSSQSGESPPFWPWLQMLGRHLDGASPALLARCRELAPLASQLVPGLRRHELNLPQAQSPHEQRAYLLEDLNRLFMALTAGSPTILWLDDLHWADEASISLLPSLARAAQQRPLVLLLTCRSTHGAYLTQTLAEVMREHPNERIDLTGLALPEVARMLEHQRPGTGGVAEQVRALTAGNPLFTLEVARLIGRSDGGSLAAQRLVAGRELSSLIRARLCELPAESLLVLRSAAVLGREFCVSELAALSELSPQAVLVALSVLEQSSLVRDLPALPGFYGFAHPLMREAGYEGLPPELRIGLHRRAGERIEQLGPDHVDTRLNELAHHFFQVAEWGCAEKARDYALRVAERARRETAYAAATQHYQHALFALDLCERRDPQLRLQIQLSLGEASAAAALGRDHVRTIFRDAAERAAALGLPDLFARAALGYMGQHPIRFIPMRLDGTVDGGEIDLLERALQQSEQVSEELRTLLLASLAFALAASTQRKRRDSLLAEALGLARAQGSPWLLARVLLLKVHTATAPDQWGELRDATDELVRLSEQLGSRELGLDARMARMVCLLQVADLEGARADATVAMRYAQALGCPNAKDRAAVLELLSAFWEGRIDDAMRMSAQAFQLSTEELMPRLLFALRMGQVWICQNGYGRRWWRKAKVMVATFTDSEGWPAALAISAAMIGERQEATTQFDLVARENFAALPEDHSWLASMQLLGETTVRLSDASRARLIYERLQPYGNRLILAGWCGYPVGSAATTLGRLASVLERHDEALRWFARARALYKQLGAVLFEAILDVAEAQALAARRAPQDRERGHALLSRARRFAERQSIAWLLQDAAATETMLGLASEAPAARGAQNMEV